ncbi:hypothetical protein [Pseudonocardia sp.]|uniref:hypothetical protein n=1 Tax=Pseudonocardia sp. TaxID=60912 RepID=UPI0026356510|nr:hypothetical protein [Pseudonocardia sp.]
MLPDARLHSIEFSPANARIAPQDPRVRGRRRPRHGRGRDAGRRRPAQVDHHPAGLEQLLEATHGTVKFLGNELMVEEFYAVSPDAAQACWATSASMGPAPALAILQAAADHDVASISRLGADIAWAHEPLLGLLSDPAAFASYNIQLEKIRMETAGYCVPGPIRPPTRRCPRASTRRPGSAAADGASCARGSPPNPPAPAVRRSRTDHQPTQSREPKTA